MDRLDIQTILGLAGSVLDRDLETYVPSAIISNETELTSLEYLGAAPLFYRAMLSTKYIEQFLNYTREQASSHVFINEENFGAVAFYDLGTPAEPKWGHHKAGLSLEKEPAYAALLKRSDVQMDQQSIIDFIEDWMENIQFHDVDGEDISSTDAIKNIRRLKIKVSGESNQDQGNYAQSRSTLEEVELQAGEVPPPAYFIFSCIPYPDLGMRDFVCSLRANAKKEGFTLAFRIIKQSAIEHEIVQEFCKKISDGLTAEHKVTIGKFSYQN
jgi:uncharacterized protein YfdQ (DUF2303 family)